MAGRKHDDKGARNTKTLQVCISGPEYESLKRLADQKQTSVSVFLRHLLRHQGVLDVEQGITDAQ